VGVERANSWHVVSLKSMTRHCVQPIEVSQKLNANTEASRQVPLNFEVQTLVQASQYNETDKREKIMTLDTDAMQH
jgi:hypothetical protein